MDNRTHGAARHRADIQARGENSARIAGRIRHGRGDQLQGAQENHRLEDQPAIESLIHIFVANAHHLRTEHQESANHKTAHGGLPDARPRR